MKIWFCKSKTNRIKTESILKNNPIMINYSKIKKNRLREF